ncbi:Meiotic fizzy-related 2 [Lecanosticta acicola]|uniref:Meiotic fizzy-related 2 n=1 Tax=Lecanosticta acicola TaxID=111012 RepID=A0AAI8Z2N4_9PEZI|nr:Meiotic fizzy-related 2 [Lecanosticta acicola]
MTPPEIPETSIPGCSSREKDRASSRAAPHSLHVPETPSTPRRRSWSRSHGLQIQPHLPLPPPRGPPSSSRHLPRLQQLPGPEHCQGHSPHLDSSPPCPPSKREKSKKSSRPTVRVRTSFRRSLDDDAASKELGPALIGTDQALEDDETDPPTPFAERGSDTDRDDYTYDTPLTTPCSSPVKACPQLDGSATPPSEDASPEPQTVFAGPTTPTSAKRHPSALLKYCEQNATPRQRRLMVGTLQTPDRFIPGRASTPTKEALRLHKPRPKHKAFFQQKLRSDEELPDPFGPPPSPSARLADGFATIRRTHPASNPPTRGTGTLVQDAVTPARRAVSSGAVWTVGGSVVTEGVASITNGRGGRVTSGTNAPHYTSDFLQRPSPSEEEVQHGRRLAMAMDVSPSSRMLPWSSSSSPASPSTPTRSSDMGPNRTVWSDGKWEKGVATTPTKPSKRKSKDIPMIPFRVLDAPALRDDYYCSLLAYSHTMQCLAVGLGPHVYLWSESRGTTPTHIPDSLTMPFGAHVTSLSFSSSEGGKAILAIGRANGRITLWSPQDCDPRFDSEQPAPVSCVCFRPNTVKRQSIREVSVTLATEELLVGDEVGNVYYYSVEWPSPDERDLFGWHGSMTLLARISCHTQQVCGLAWSKEGQYFATGGNDNQMYLFEPKRLFADTGNKDVHPADTVDVRSGNSNGDGRVAGQNRVLAVKLGQQKHTFTLNAAVKAISFAPWQESLLAAGGGSNDRCIHFFHALSGATLATIDCHAQVTSLVWSEQKKEIAATFGFAQPEHAYRVAVFSWPTCRRVVGIPWWSGERALYAIAYPGGPNGAPSPSTSTSTSGRMAQGDVEGQAWYGRRTTEEGCLVIATSDASIKFHEVWPERSEQGRGAKGVGILGGSLILEDGVSDEMEREVTIR